MDDEVVKPEQAVREMLLARYEEEKSKAVKKRLEAAEQGYYAWRYSIGVAVAAMRKFCEEHGHDISLLQDKFDADDDGGNHAMPV